jgi:hypothetical protein
MNTYNNILCLSDAEIVSSFIWTMSKKVLYVDCVYAEHQAQPLHIFWILHFGTVQSF